MQFTPHCTKIMPHCVPHTCLLQIFCLVMNCKRSSTTLGLQTRSVARQAHLTPRSSDPMVNRTRPVITSLGSLNASGQPVVQEVDSISTPLEETDRSNGPEVTSNIIATLGNTPVSKFKAILPSLLEYFQGKNKNIQSRQLSCLFSRMARDHF